MFDALPPDLDAKLGANMPFLLSTDALGRVPDRQHRLLQAGIRTAPDQTPDALICETVDRLGLHGPPIVASVDHWPEADLQSRYDAAHAATIRAIKAQLPAGLSLIGSDYCLEAPTVKGVARLDERISLGRAAARAAEGYLQTRRRR